MVMARIALHFQCFVPRSVIEPLPDRAHGAALRIAQRIGRDARTAGRYHGEPCRAPVRRRVPRGRYLIGSCAPRSRGRSLGRTGGASVRRWAASGMAGPSDPQEDAADYRALVEALAREGLPRRVEAARAVEAVVCALAQRLADPDFDVLRELLARTFPDAARPVRAPRDRRRVPRAPPKTSTRSSRRTWSGTATRSSRRSARCSPRCAPSSRSRTRRRSPGGCRSTSCRCGAVRPERRSPAPRGEGASRSFLTHRSYSLARRRRPALHRGRAWPADPALAPTRRSSTPPATSSRRQGVERARVEDIARRAGISKGAFYLHFRTKDDAFREIAQRFLGALEDHARRRHEVEDRLGREVGAGRRRPGRSSRRSAPSTWICSSCSGATGRSPPPSTARRRKLYRDLLADFRRRVRALVSRRIVERQRAGALRPDVDPEVFGDIVVGTYEDFARRMAEMREKPDLAAWARSLLVVLYEGILARPDASPRAPRPADPLVIPESSDATPRRPPRPARPDPRPRSSRRAAGPPRPADAAQPAAAPRPRRALAPRRAGPRPARPARRGHRDPQGAAVRAARDERPRHAAPRSRCRRGQEVREGTLLASLDDGAAGGRGAAGRGGRGRRPRAARARGGRARPRRPDPRAGRRLRGPGVPGARAARPRGGAARGGGGAARAGARAPRAPPPARPVPRRRHARPRRHRDHRRARGARRDARLDAPARARDVPHAGGGGRAPAGRAGAGHRPGDRRADRRRGRLGGGPRGGRRDEPRPGRGHGAERRRPLPPERVRARGAPARRRAGGLPRPGGGARAARRAATRSGSPAPTRRRAPSRSGCSPRTATPRWCSRKAARGPPGCASSRRRPSGSPRARLVAEAAR